MYQLNFREWESSQNPRILLPYLKHRREIRLSDNNRNIGKRSQVSISNSNLRSDYEYAINEIEQILSRNDTLPVMYRKILRSFEKNNHHMQERARIDQNYSRDLADTHADEDIWNFVASIEDMMHGKPVNLESFL